MRLYFNEVQRRGGPDPPVVILIKWSSLVMFLCRAFPCLVRSADFGIGGAMTETSQAGSEDYFFALRFFSGGSSTPVRTSSKSRSTSRP